MRLCNSRTQHRCIVICKDDGNNSKYLFFLAIWLLLKKADRPHISPGRRLFSCAVISAVAHPSSGLPLLPMAVRSDVWQNHTSEKH